MWGENVKKLCFLGFCCEVRLWADVTPLLEFTVNVDCFRIPLGCSRGLRAVLWWLNPLVLICLMSWESCWLKSRSTLWLQQEFTLHFNSPGANFDSRKRALDWHSYFPTCNITVLVVCNQKKFNIKTKYSCFYFLNLNEEWSESEGATPWKDVYVAEM